MKKLILLVIILSLVSCKRSAWDLAKEINQPYGTKVFYLYNPALNNPPADSVSDSSFTVTGQASNSLGISKIEVFVIDSGNNTTTYVASGFAPFTRTVTLSQGENRIYVKATLSDTSTVFTSEIKIYYNWQFKTSLDIEAGEPIIGQNGATAYIYSGQTNFNPWISTDFYSYDMSNNLLAKISNTAKKFWSGNGCYDSATGLHVLNGFSQVYKPEPYQIEIRNDKAYKLNTSGAEISNSSIELDFRRAGASQAVVGRNLYIIGGWKYDSTPPKFRKLTNTILVYNLDTGVITNSGAALIDPVYNPQVFVYNGKIYIFGGLLEDDYNYSHRAYTYTPGAGAAMPIDPSPPIIWHRAGAAVVVKGDKAYVIGGEHFFNQNDNTVKDLSDQVELLTLSPSSGIVSSKTLTRMPLKMGFFGALYNSGNNKIYTFGGRTNNTFTYSKAIYEYTPEK